MNDLTTKDEDSIIIRVAKKYPILAMTMVVQSLRDREADDRAYYLEMMRRRIEEEIDRIENMEGEQ